MRAIPIAVLLTAVSCVAAQAMPPTPNDASTIRDMTDSARATVWYNKLVAMRGNAVGVAHDVKGQPLVNLRVGTGSDSQTIWIAAPAGPEDTFVAGDEILILGLMTRVPADLAADLGSTLGDIVKDPYMVFGICLMNLTAEWGGGLPKYRSACNEWFFDKRVPAQATVDGLALSDGNAEP